MNQLLGSIKGYADQIILIIFRNCIGLADVLTDTAPDAFAL
jgi:hypothetical protein